MGRRLAIAVLSSVAIAQLSFAGVKSGKNAGVQSASTDESAPVDLGTLPPVPPGRSTVIGGIIRDVDPVRDQLTLKVFGGRPIKLLFDERTQMYRDGKRTPLRDLRTDDHASIETVLDGTNVFALSIHMLSQSPEGECQGQVLNYNPATRELTVSDELSHSPVKLQVPPGAAIVRRGQAALASKNFGSSDLIKGDLIAVKFESGNDGGGIASQIAILATPGSAFVFNGNVAFLDVNSKLLVLADPRDDKNYKIFFDSARVPMSRDLHEGAHVTVTANFDGARYVASAITVH